MKRNNTFWQIAALAAAALSVSCAGNAKKAELHAALQPSVEMPLYVAEIGEAVEKVDSLRGEEGVIADMIAEDPLTVPPEWVDGRDTGDVAEAQAPADLWVEEPDPAAESVLLASLPDGAATGSRGLADIRPAMKGGKPETAIDPLWDVPYDVSMEVNEAVHLYLEYFQTRLRPTFSRYLIRSGRYIPLMQDIFAEYGLPRDLVYVSLIESGFNPYAYSRARAAGPWQFIASTGKRYGLRYDYWVDERRDVVLATHAAAKYLTDLYQRFGDWYLALASYNAGEGNIAVALKRTGAETFWELREAHAIPQETRDYVPKFIAATLIAKNPEEYGFFVEEHAPMETDVATVEGATDLAAIARAVGVSEEEVQFLNPQLRRGMTPPDGKPYQVRIPAGSDELFAENFPGIREAEQSLWAKKAKEMGPVEFVRHRVRSGETLSVIARKYRTRVSSIQRANHMGRSTVIQAGRTLLIPTGRHYAGPSGGSGGEVQHRVRRGDTLWKIAERYNVRLRDLMAWNGLSSKSVLQPGDRIIIKMGGG